PQAGSEKYRILGAKASRRKAREGALQRLRPLSASARAKFSSPNAVIPHRHGCPIGENEGWPEGDAGPRIVAAHDRGHVVAADEKARDRFAHLRQYAAVGVGPQTHAASQRARIHGHRVIGRRRDAAETWIRCVVRIAIVAVEFGRAFAELLVLAGLGKAIVLSHRFAQTPCVHANLAGKRPERGRPPEITAGAEPAQGAPPRRGAGATRLSR